MNVLVIGATGPLGQEIVASALAAKHSVTALARDPAKTSFPAEVQVARGDVLNRGSLTGAVRGQNAVISSLGSKLSLKPTTLLSEGTRNVVDAMRQAGVRRLICITGIGAGDSQGHGGVVYDHIIQPLLLNQIYKDKTRQEAVVRESGLDWTIVRPAQLTNGPARGAGAYRVLTDLGGVTATKIARKDVSAFTVDLLVTPKHLHEAVLVTY
jgi:putative NADH-flavin reductase